MTEESLSLGRPPRPPRRGGRWTARAPGVAVALALAGLAGWALWHGAVDDEPAAPGPGTVVASPTAPPSTGGVVPPPAVPYLRSGTLVRPSEPAIRLPDAGWTDFAVLTDDRVVLAQRETVTVLGPGRARTYWLSGGAPGLSARPDGSGVAWTGPDGRLRLLRSGDPQAVTVRGLRQLVPACRGLAGGTDELPDWASCDRDGRLLSPGGAWSARIGDVSVNVLPRLDPGGGTSVAFLGVVDDAVWEDPAHLLVVVRVGDEAHLVRVGSDGTSADVIAPVHGAGDTDRHPLLLPATSLWLSMQP